MSFRATTPGNVVEELLLQHPLDFFSFSFLDFDWIEELSLLIVIVFLPFLCVSNSGKSAVGPAEYRLTLSSRPSSTSCFPSALNTSLTSVGEYIAPAIVSFRPIKRTRRFSPARSLASNAASLELLVADLVFPPARHNHKSKPFACDTSDLAPGVPFHHSAILASLGCTSSTRARDARARHVYP